jgi:hypothetical protein
MYNECVDVIVHHFMRTKLFAKTSHYVHACIVHDDGSVNLRMRIIALTWKDI